ncbi:hypothetical protein B9T25_06805 [Acinetobacter sp. ANC 4470]|nr:hypothetical protein B9T25_06805 [Acinetobacter sp. ANC 4470]
MDDKNHENSLIKMHDYISFFNYFYLLNKIPQPLSFRLLKKTKFNQTKLLYFIVNIQHITKISL